MFSMSLDKIIHSLSNHPQSFKNHSPIIQNHSKIIQKSFTDHSPIIHQRFFVQPRLIHVFTCFYMFLHVFQCHVHVAGLGSRLKVRFKSPIIHRSFTDHSPIIHRAFTDHLPKSGCPFGFRQNQKGHTRKLESLFDGPSESAFKVTKKRVTLRWPQKDRGPKFGPDFNIRPASY